MHILRGQLAIVVDYARRSCAVDEAPVIGAPVRSLESGKGIADAEVAASLLGNVDVDPCGRAQ